MVYVNLPQREHNCFCDRPAQLIFTLAIKPTVTIPSSLLTNLPLGIHVDEQITWAQQVNYMSK